MTKKEAKAYTDKARAFTKRVTSSSQKSRQFLVNAGICTTKGNLKKPFR